MAGLWVKVHGKAKPLNPLACYTVGDIVEEKLLQSSQVTRNCFHLRLTQVVNTYRCYGLKTLNYVCKSLCCQCWTKYDTLYRNCRKQLSMLPVCMCHTGDLLMWFSGCHGTGRWANRGEWSHDLRGIQTPVWPNQWEHRGCLQTAPCGLQPGQ